MLQEIAGKCLTRKTNKQEKMFYIVLLFGKIVTNFAKNNETGRGITVFYGDNPEWIFNHFRSSVSLIMK